MKEQIIPGLRDLNEYPPMADEMTVDQAIEIALDILKEGRLPKDEADNEYGSGEFDISDPAVTRHFHELGC